MKFEDLKAVKFEDEVNNITSRTTISGVRAVIVAKSNKYYECTGELIGKGKLKDFWRLKLENGEETSVHFKTLRLDHEADEWIRMRNKEREEAVALQIEIEKIKLEAQRIKEYEERERQKIIEDANKLITWIES